MFKRVKEDAKLLAANDKFMKCFNRLIVPIVFLANLAVFVFVVYILIKQPGIYYRFWETLFAIMLLMLTINIFLEMIQVEVDENNLKSGKNDDDE